jgi:hypothetical protein
MPRSFVAAGCIVMSEISGDCLGSTVREIAGRLMLTALEQLDWRSQFPTLTKHSDQLQVLINAEQMSVDIIADRLKQDLRYVRARHAWFPSAAARLRTQAQAQAFAWRVEQVRREARVEASRGVNWSHSNHTYTFRLGHAYGQLVHISRHGFHGT